MKEMIGHALSVIMGFFAMLAVIGAQMLIDGIPGAVMMAG